MKTIQDADQKEFIGEYGFEELSYLGEFSLLPKRRVEEDILDEVDELNLHNVLLIQNDLTQHLEEVIHDVTDQLLAEDRVIDVVQKGLD